MNDSSAIHLAYAFHVDAIKDGFCYFRTVSLWAGTFGEHGRDVRKPGQVIVNNFEIISRALGQSFRWIEDERGLDASSDGWILVPEGIAECRLKPLLEARTCVKSPLGLYWDEVIPRNRAARRRIPSDVRQRLLERDDHRCVECRRGALDGVKLTMDHVIPFSRGGETTEWNLVTLCEPCNQGYGNSDHPHLFALAGLHSGWDPALMNSTATTENATLAIMMSQNIMVSRCRASLA